jgi:FeS assembly protein IscX
MTPTGPHPLYWDATWAIVCALMEHYPDHSPQEVGLLEIAALVEQLPGFADDPVLVTRRILLDIQSTWYEETLP